MSTVAPASGGGRHLSPLPFFIVGLLAIILWLCGSMLELESSEAFLLSGSPVTTFVPNLSVLMQPFALISGHLSPEMVKAVIWAWTIEILYLICIVGFETAHEGLKHSNHHIARWFGTGVILAIGFDAWTNFQYGNLASGIWGQVAFALATSICVAVFGVIGIHFIARGIKEWQS